MPICYSEPFKEMRGDIIYIDYELSDWRYLNEEKKGLPKSDQNVRIVYKTCIQPPEFFRKGSGSAYGGKWIPQKKEDKRFLGKPGEIKEYLPRTEKNAGQKSEKTAEQQKKGIFPIITSIGHTQIHMTTK